LILTDPRRELGGPSFGGALQGHEPLAFEPVVGAAQITFRTPEVVFRPGPIACRKEARFQLEDKGLLAGAETYAANLEDAVANGVFGAPFYVVDGVERFWGQDRIGDLDTYLSGGFDG
jgi:hypothetical protein